MASEGNSPNHVRSSDKAFSRVMESNHSALTLIVGDASGTQKLVQVTDATTVREILEQCDEEVDLTTLLQGVTKLELDMSVGQAGLQDRDELSIVRSYPWMEMQCWTGEEMRKDLYAWITTDGAISECAFSGCTRLVKVIMHDSVTSIGGEAFSGCSSLKEVQIPNSLTSMGAGAFLGCSSLKAVQIPNSVTEIGEGAFRDCSSLKEVQIPNSVTRIGGSCFYNCRSLTKVQIPNSVTSIGIEAFSGCSSLTEMQIPNSVTRIGKSAFWGCSRLTKVPVL